MKESIYFRDSDDEMPDSDEDPDDDMDIYNSQTLMINFKELNLKMPFRYIFQEVFRDGFNNVIEQLNPQTAAGGSHQHSKMTINNKLSSNAGPG